MTFNNRSSILSEQKKNKKTWKGFFLTFEGIDGCGKTLQARALCKTLEKKNHPVLLVRDPGGPPISERIRRVILDRDNGIMSPITELFLYEAARGQLVDEQIRPALEQGQIVIADRFTDSTIAYQGYGRSLPLSLIKDSNRWACGDVLPQRTYFFDIPWEESLRRRSGQGKDRMEKQNEEFFMRVREGYLALGLEDKDRIRVFDGTRSISQLEQEILADVLTHVERHFTIKIHSMESR